MRSPIARLVVFAVLCLLPLPAHAIPAFARSTGFECTACHNAWPELNATGRLFKDRGYRLPGVDSSLLGQSPAYFPVSARAFVGYQYVRQQQQGSGGVKFPEVDIIMAGALSEHVSFELLPSGFGAGGEASLEAGWASLHAWLGDVAVSAKVGRHELDLPASEHRSLTLGTPYLAYHHHPQGSTAAFEIGENQTGGQLLATSRDDRFRAAVSILNANGSPGTHHFWSTPVVYAHLTAAFPIDSAILHRVRIGALGWVGYWPTAFDADASGAPVSLSGGSLKRFQAYGGDTTLRLGSEALPFTLRAAYLRGGEDLALTPDATQAPAWHGGFVEAIWLPMMDLAMTARVEGAWSTVAAVEGAPPGQGDQTGLVLSARYYLFFSPRASAAVHAEWSDTRTVAGAEDGGDLSSKLFMLGIDFAI